MMSMRTRFANSICSPYSKRVDKHLQLGDSHLKVNEVGLKHDDLRRGLLGSTHLYSVQENIQ